MLSVREDLGEICLKDINGLDMHGTTTVKLILFRRLTKPWLTESY